jgi:uncharacterized protein
MSWQAHLQSISCMLPGTVACKVPTEVVELPLPTGGSLVLECQWQDHAAPAAVIMHGIAGTSQDPYVRRAAGAAVARGLHAIRLNQRGTGLGRDKSHTIYHPGQTEDLHLVEAMLRTRQDVDGMHLLGFSLGGHTALRYAAESRASSLLRSVATISAPTDLAAMRVSFGHRAPGITGVYQWLMVSSVLRNARAALQRSGNPFRMPLSTLRTIRSLAEVEDRLLLPMHGFSDADSYHAQASVLPHAQAIDVPSLMIHAADDPVVPAAQADAAVARNPLLRALITKVGGHVGFHTHWSQLRGSSFAVSQALAHAEAHR